MRTDADQPRWADSDYLRQRALDMRQYARIDEYRADVGDRRIRLTAAGGFDAEVLVDRGMDLGNVSYQGIPLGFCTPAVYAVPPADGSGESFFRRFGAGLLTTCGMDHFGAPAHDGGQDLPQHGRAADIPATQVRTETAWGADGFQLTATGSLRQWRLFGEDLQWERTISTALGGNTLTVRDEVVNAGTERWPHMVLYHVNLGHPMIDAGTVVRAASGREPEPWHGNPADRPLDWRQFPSPASDFIQQVFRHDLRSGDAGEVSVTNPDLGLTVTVRVDQAQLPYVFQWVMAGQGTYVLGIEPANAPVIDGRAAAREVGGLQFLEPGESRSYQVEIEVERTVL